MRAGGARPLQRLTATAVALALLMGSVGCASPYHFSPLLHTRQPQPGAQPPSPPLAGDLHLSLEALMDQRRLLWQAAGEAEQMKTATALGLIGLGAAALYRGARYTDNTGWMQRAGLVGATAWAGATWLEPSARQSIYLQGAVSLTCLALATAPYEMTVDEYNAIRDDIRKARNGLEQLATALRLAGRYEKHSETWWLVRGGWNKLRWANRVLDSADVAMGNIEQAGPRLRDMAALLTSDVATHVNRVTKDLNELPSALASLKLNAAKLVGADVFAPPKKEGFNEDPPGTSTEREKNETNGKLAPEPSDPLCGVGTPAPVSPALAQLGQQVESAAAAATRAAQSASAAASAASAAVQGIAPKGPPATKPTKAQVAEQQRAVAAALADSAAEASVKEQKQALEKMTKERAQRAKDMADHAAASGLRERLKEATDLLDSHLGAVASFVQRVASARDGLELPKGCGTATPVRLVPDKRDLVLQAGESFQFVLEGDSGKAAASFLGLSLLPDVLDITMPLVQATTAVRLSAGTAATRAVSTVVRISDSKREQSFDITVKVCPALR